MQRRAVTAATTLVIAAYLVSFVYLAVDDPAAAFAAQSGGAQDAVCIWIYGDPQNLVKYQPSGGGCSPAAWGDVEDPNDDGSCSQRSIFNSMWKRILDADCTHKIVVGVGDNTQFSEAAWDSDGDPNSIVPEWDRITAFWKHLADAGIVTLIARGNHDSQTKYTQYLGPLPSLPAESVLTAPIDWSAYDWYAGHNDLGCEDGIDPHHDPNDPSSQDCDDTYAVAADLGEVKIAGCALSCSPDPNEYLFCRNHFAAHSDHLGIVVTHYNMKPKRGASDGGDHNRLSGSFGPWSTSCSEETPASGIVGQAWQDVVVWAHDNVRPGYVLFNVGGHYVGQRARLLLPDLGETDTEDLGVGVFSTVNDFQSGVRSDGGRGYIGEILLDPGAGTLLHRVYSPYDDRYIVREMCYDDDSAGDPDNRLCISDPLWKLGGGRWKAWDEHFRGTAEPASDWQVENLLVWADIFETNEYFELIERGGGYWRATYIFDESGRISGFMVSGVPGVESPRGRGDEFQAWAREHHPDEAEYLMPGGSIDPTGDRAPRMRALLNEWRGVVGLEPIE